MTVTRRKVVLGLLAAAMGAAAWMGVTVFRHRIPPELMKDIRAGLPARSIQDPDVRLHTYLQNRYGPLSEATNREAVFVDFFNVERIKALQFLVVHSPPEHRQANIDAMARWVDSYRQSLTSEERRGLSARFGTPEGQAMLKRATAAYNSQDVRYRGNTAGVISQLLRTLNEAERAQN